MTQKLILASASPRRRQLLAQIGIRAEVRPSRAEEHPVSRQPQDIVKELAEVKCRSVAEELRERRELEEGSFLLGADTIVVLDGRVLGKPASPEDAAAMLKALSGRTHQVFTGVCLIRIDETGRIPERETGPYRCFAERTDVTFAELTEEEIRAYVASGEPMDKAGAYGIQGIFARHVTGIRGDHTNVVGLPVAVVYRALRELDFRI